MKLLSIYLRAFALLIALTALAGCETTAPQAKEPPPEAFAVKRGDSVMTLIEQMGEPEKKSTIEKAGSTGEIWAYLHQMRSKIRMVPTGTREVPVFDRETEQVIMVSEPIFTQEFSKLDQITEFLIMDGLVVSWKQRVADDRIQIE